MNTAVMNVLKAAVTSLGGEFEVFLPALLQHCMSVLPADNTAGDAPVTHP
jgi:hypothetical protein